MDLASLIISILALGLTVFNTIMFWSKYFSSHTVQLVPADQAIPNMGKAKTIEDQFREFDQPPPQDLDEDEIKYFNKFN